MTKEQETPKENSTWWERTKANMGPIARQFGRGAADAILTGALIAGTIFIIRGSSDGYESFKNKYVK